MSQVISTLPNAIALGLIWGILAIGVYITYKVLNFSDLAVDGSICTGAAICSVLMTNGLNVYLALLISVLITMLAGLITGLFHTRLGIPAILSGILTQLILWSINLKIMGKANISLSARNFKVLVTQMSTLKSILILLLIVAIIIALLYWFFGTEIGSAIRATGNNQQMSQAQGINTKLMIVLGLMISNAIVGLAGALLAQYSGFADINMGKGALVIGLASIIIGETLLSKISVNFAFRMFSVVFGGICYYIIYQIVIFTGIDTDLLKMLSAIIVAIFLGVPYIKGNIIKKEVK